LLLLLHLCFPLFPYTTLFRCNATHQGSVVCRLLVFPEVRDYSSTTRDRCGVGRVIVLQRNGDGLLLLVTDNDDPTVSDVEEIQLLDNVGVHDRDVVISVMKLWTSLLRDDVGPNYGKSVLVEGQRLVVDGLSNVIDNVLDLGTRRPLTVLTGDRRDGGHLLRHIPEERIDVVDVAFALKNRVSLRQATVHEDLRPVVSRDLSNDHIVFITSLGRGGQQEDPQRPFNEVIVRLNRTFRNEVGSAKGQLVHPAALRRGVNFVPERPVESDNDFVEWP